MNNLLDLIMDLICSVLGIEGKFDEKPGLLRGLLRVLLGFGMILVGILKTMLSLLRFRPRQRRLLSRVLLGCVIVIITTLVILLVMRLPVWGTTI